MRVGIAALFLVAGVLALALGVMFLRRRTARYDLLGAAVCSVAGLSLGAIGLAILVA